MADKTTPYLSSGRRGEWVRVRTLVNLRWLAVAGQTLAVLVAAYGLRIDLRLDLVAIVIGLSVAVNLATTLVHPETKRLGHRDALLTLFFDLAQLSLMLYLTGGLNNPFAMLIMAPTIISATVLSMEATLFLGASTLASVSFLIFYHEPLQTASGSALMMPPLLVYGMWIALMISVAFLSGYARRVTMETMSLSEALTATQLALEREQKLTDLGGVVAAAAHELGTPLATIKLVSAELADEIADRPELLEDVELIRSQAERCRMILADMGRSGKDDLHLKHVPILGLVEEAAEPHLDRGVKVIFRVDGALADEAVPDQPTVARHSEIIHGLRNLVQNAVDFARSTVWIDIDWTERDLRIVVGDDGKGFAPDMIGRIGDPFMRRKQASRTADPQRPGYEGMGLGLFIAKTLLERTGARLTFASGSGDGPESAQDLKPAELARPTGAVVELIWSRDALEVDRKASRGPLGHNQKLFS